MTSKQKIQVTNKKFSYLDQLRFVVELLVELQLRLVKAIAGIVQPMAVAESLVLVGVGHEEELGGCFVVVQSYQTKAD